MSVIGFPVHLQFDSLPVVAGIAIPTARSPTSGSDRSRASGSPGGRGGQRPLRLRDGEHNGALPGSLLRGPLARR